MHFIDWDLDRNVDTLQLQCLRCVDLLQRIKPINMQVIGSVHYQRKCRYAAHKRQKEHLASYSSSVVYVRLSFLGRTFVLFWQWYADADQINAREVSSIIAYKKKRWFVNDVID